jgi:hypothetical protein
MYIVGRMARRRARSFDSVALACARARGRARRRRRVPRARVVGAARATTDSDARWAAALTLQPTSTATSKQRNARRRRRRLPQHAGALLSARGAVALEDGRWRRKLVGRGPAGVRARAARPSALHSLCASCAQKPLTAFGEPANRVGVNGDADSLDQSSKGHTDAARTPRLQHPVRRGLACRDADS